MYNQFSDSTADKFIFYALFAWAASCVHPALGFLLQFPAIIYLAWKCDIKTLPALMILMLSKANVRLLSSADPETVEVGIKIGITLKHSNVMLLTAFFFTLVALVKRKLDRPSQSFAFFWLLSAIPAAVMAAKGKALGGLGGSWSSPVMDFLAPSIYFWGICMARTYLPGRRYFIKRMTIFLLLWNLLSLVMLVEAFTYIPLVMSACMCIYLARDDEFKNLRVVGIAGFIIGFLAVLFVRYQHLVSMGADVVSADRRGSTFSSMGVYAVGILLSLMLKNVIGNSIARILPILMVVANIALVSFVITTQAGNQAVETTLKYETMNERFTMKLFGDRGAVWSLGWDDTKTPPYIFKDPRQQFMILENGLIMPKVLPHNQYLTLLSRDGLWLGVVLSLFIIWVQMRAFRAMTECRNDMLFVSVMVPVGAAIFCIVGTAGQSVAQGALWGNSFATMVMPAIVYGNWVERKKFGMVSC